MIDPAMCRPGRLDKLLYVDLPSRDERVEIIRTLIRNVPLGALDREDMAAFDVVRTAVEDIVREKCEGYSGADLAALVREAGVVALRRTLGALDAVEETIHAAARPILWVELNDFSNALSKVQPSVSIAQRRKYEALRQKFAGLPVQSGREEFKKSSDSVDS